MFRGAMKAAWGFILLGVVLDLIFSPVEWVVRHQSGIKLWELVQYWWQTGHSPGTLLFMVGVGVGCWLLLTVVIYLFLRLNKWLGKRDRI